MNLGITFSGYLNGNSTSEDTSKSDTPARGTDDTTADMGDPLRKGGLLMRTVDIVSTRNNHWQSERACVGFNKKLCRSLVKMVIECSISVIRDHAFSHRASNLITTVDHPERK